MPGSIVFRPIEANLTHNTELIGKMDPYVQFILGNHKVRTNVCRKGGKHPCWDDSVTIPASAEFGACLVEIKDKDILKDDRIGACEIDLREIESQGSIKRWFPVFHKDKPAGEILMEACYSGDNFANQGFQSMNAGLAQPGFATGGIAGYAMPLQTQGTAPTMGTMSVGEQYAEQALLRGVTGGLIQPGGFATGGFAGSGFALQQQAMTPTLGSKSLAEQYAEEALLRGVDPLHSHSAELNYQPQPCPHLAGDLQAAPPLVNPGQLANKDIPINNQGALPLGTVPLQQSGFGIGNVPLQQSGFGIVNAPLQQSGFGIGNVPPNLSHGVPLGGGSFNNQTNNPNTPWNLKNQVATPIQHDQTVPVGVGIGSDYLTNNVTIAPNMGTAGHHAHVHDHQKVFGHGHHAPETGTVFKEGINPTTFGPKTNPQMDTYDRKIV